MATSTVPNKDVQTMIAGPDPLLRVASWISLAHAGLWALLLGRWLTFSSFDWTPFDFENLLADGAGIIPYLLYGVGIAVDLVIGVSLIRQAGFARRLGIGRNTIVIAAALLYWVFTREFFGAIILAGLAGMMLLLLMRQTAWAINYPAAFWLVIFFVLPNIIVFIISLSERGPRGTIVFPEFTFQGILQLFDDYGRIFGRIGGELIYLRIFWRSVWLAVVNTILCLLLGYPFAYWIARQPQRWRNILIFLVMIPFWTNFLVRTYAWMLLLRDSGLINNVWTMTIHDQAVALSGSSQFFSWLADLSAEPMTLLFTQGAVFLGLFYGYFPFVVLPLYSNLEKLDWSLLEAAADLGANGYRSTVRILLPLSMPGIVAAGIIVFIPSLGAYVTPALMGGGKVALLGNLLQQQFLTARDYPFGSAIGFMMMALMLLAIVLFFRVEGDRN